MSEIRPITWLQHVIKMTSQVVTADGELEILEIRSYSRGYHAYADTWTPVVGETLQNRLTFGMSMLWLSIKKAQ